MASFFEMIIRSEKKRGYLASVWMKEVSRMGTAKVPGSARKENLIRMMRSHGDRLVGLCTGLLNDHMLA